MSLLFTPTGFLEIAIFSLAIMAFALAVRFFIDSRKRLQELFPGTLHARKLLPFGIDRSGFVIPNAIERMPEPVARPLFRTTASAEDSTRQELRSLRTQLQQQQLELARALEQISGLNNTRSPRGDYALPEEQRQLEHLRSQLAARDSEINRLRQQELFSQKLQEQLDEAQADYDKLQDKLEGLEKQAWEAAELKLQLEQAEQAQRQLEKTLLKKEEKLRELVQEHQQAAETKQELEQKLVQAGTQRQQLLKKVHYLEEINADMLQMGETNQRLKGEIGRVAELESMLQMITEERNSLLRRR